MESKDGKQPSDKLFCFSASTQSWQEVKVTGSPALSHHAGVGLAGRYLILIGGWDGRQRTSKVVVFDAEKQQWLFPTISGFPEDGGLSSHTATLLASGEILVLGREGSLRMQRRHGSGYTLSGSVESGHFTFKEYTQAISSRSGHTTNIIGSTLYVIGGRENNLIEMHGRFRSGETDSQTVFSKFEHISETLTSMSKLPGGRKNHITIGNCGMLFIHGGDTFDGRSRESVGQMYLVTVQPVMQFYKLGDSSVRRAGHICCLLGDKVLLHGGMGGKNNSRVYGDTYALEIG